MNEGSFDALTDKLSEYHSRLRRQKKIHLLVWPLLCEWIVHIFFLYIFLQRALLLWIQFNAVGCHQKRYRQLKQTSYPIFPITIEKTFLITATGVQDIIIIIFICSATNSIVSFFVFVFVFTSSWILILGFTIQMPPTTFLGHNLFFAVYVSWLE